MKKVLFTILLVLVCLPAAWAQNSNGETNVKQVANKTTQAKSVHIKNGSLFTAEDLEGVFLHSSYIGGLQELAMDVNQYARIKTVGDNNITKLNQINGTANIGIINIVGNTNNTTLTQNGSRLFSAIKVKGDDNNLDVNQRGNNLQNLILLQGSNLDFDVKQNAGGVKLTQTGSGIPLQITKSGGAQTIPIIIRNH